MSKLELKLVCVKVRRGNEVMNVTAPEHEVRVLKAMHGLDNVQQVAELDPEVESLEVEDNAEAEIARLDRRYKHNGQQRNPVDVAFPMRELDLERYGFKAGGPQAETPRSATTVRKPAKKKAAEKK